MASIPVISTSSDFRETFFEHGGENAARCYQCATCSSVCELAPANAPVITMTDTRRLWVRAYVPEDMLSIAAGQRVAVSVDSFPDERFAGHIGFIARQAEFTPGNVQTPEDRSKQVFRIKVFLDEGLDRLRPGMAADVWLDEGALPATPAATS